MITGWGAQFDAGTLKDDGVDFLVTKPFDYEKIMRVIQDALASFHPETTVSGFRLSAISHQPSEKI
jgi:FixJ family two-component response regulator